MENEREPCNPGEMNVSALTCRVRRLFPMYHQVQTHPARVCGGSPARPGKLHPERVTSTKRKDELHHRQWTGGGTGCAHEVRGDNGGETADYAESRRSRLAPSGPGALSVRGSSEDRESESSENSHIMLVSHSSLYNSLTVTQTQTRCGVQAKGRPYRTRSSPCWTFWTSPLITLIVLHSVLLAGIVRAQDTCSDTSDCHPPSENLLDEDYPLRTLEASSTCGTQGVSTRYRKSSSTLDFRDFECNASYPHPPELMHDHQNEKVLDFFEYENPKLSTYWQSENTIDFLGAVPRTEWVVLNLTEPFLIRFVRVVFISPHIESRNDDSDMRPLAMVIERQSHPGASWEPLRYYAENCLTYFSGAPWQPLDGSGPNYDALTAVCQQRYYAGSTPVTGWGYGRQEVLFNPSNDYDREFQLNPLVQRHYMASAVRLRLVHPADTEPLSSYYAIADLEVDGQCSCFGHASLCTDANAATCVCHHFTEGDNCERCQPLYNNKPWMPGAFQEPNACEDCGCGGHATSCHYDEQKGYGVCDNCTDNTTGDKCHYCIDHFYINPENTTLISPTALCSGFNGTEFVEYNCNDYCIPCNCSLLGSEPSSQFTCQNSSGQCACKAHVESRDCSICRDEFYNLTRGNPLGCTPCDCERSGTFNNSQLCDKDTGACICKNNTDGYRCDACKMGYYGLSADDPEGCRPCDCDPGASFNTSCPADTGVCPCRSNIGGLTCRQPNPGLYVPALDHLTFDAEFVANVTDEYTVVERPGHGEMESTITGRGFVQLPETSTLTLKVKVPRTLMYHVILRYESPAFWMNAHISLMPSSSGHDEEYSCSDSTHTTSTPLQLQMTVQPSALRGGADFGQLCLLGDLQYDLHVELGNADPRGDFFLLDSVVLLPSLTELPFFGDLSPEERAAMQTCYMLTVPLDFESRFNESCSHMGYSIMSYLYDGAQECYCHWLGSDVGACDPIGGQCPCLPGVMLLDCSQCKVDHYGFHTGQGCTPCNCDPNGSVYTACNDTGICPCKQNVEGVKCDTCADQYYGLFTGAGCQECTCNLQYAYNNSCLDSGQCHCKPGVGGQNCDYCLDGYFDLTEEGCSPCRCDSRGSTSLVCDKTTGICPCKTLVFGDKCDQCQQGFFAIGDWSPLGCLECYCSGHSTECHSASGWFLTNASNDWSLLAGNSAIQEPWTAADGHGNHIPVHLVTKIIGNVGQFVMQITNSDGNEARDDIFFLATDSYLGNKRSAYMHHLSLALSLHVPPPVGNGTHDPMLIESREGDVIIETAHLDFRLVLGLPTPLNENVTRYSFQLRVENWHVNTVDGPYPTYVQMIQVLSQISAIKVRAKYSNVTGAEVALYSAMLTYATNSDVSGIPVNNVENCTCPRQYTGQQCEECALGYTRLTPSGGPYTECVPCNCHGHGDPDVPCDPETGTCSCVHNTQGRTCNECLPGYYGDPTRGAPDACKACMCPGNVIEGDVNVFATTCSLGPVGLPICHNCSEGHGGDQCDVCLNHYFGVPTDPSDKDGRCVPCVCNGRADTCNSTSGECIDCANNTAGQECDICAPTFFGNAMLVNCRPCNCELLGATGDCDHRTGQCVCKPNVVGFSCSECGPNSFNYSSGVGCFPCDCHPIGSLDQQCDVVTGQCVCNLQLKGRRCDRCQDAYWNINDRTGCDPCECTEAGTANITGQTFGTCDVLTGQCQCAREAIIGRTCDYCAKGTKGTYPTCELCGECFDNWARKIDMVGEETAALYDEALFIWSHYANMTVDEVMPIIGNLSANITVVDASMNDTYWLVQSLHHLQQGYANVASNATVLEEQVFAIEAVLEEVQGTLFTLQQFDGTIQLDPASPSTATPQGTADMLEDVRNLHRSLDDEADASWVVIQNLTEAVRVSNGSVAVFTERVRVAMLVLDDTHRMGEVAAMMLDDNFDVENANNSDRARELATETATLPEVVGNARRLADGATGLVVEANATIDSARSAVSSKLGEMTAKFSEAQVSFFNATNAKAAADEASIAVNILEATSNYTWRNMTLALVDVVHGLTVTDNITAEVAAIDDASTVIANTEISPLAEISDITTQIEATSVSDGEVQAILTRTDFTLSMASTAINITETAANEAHLTLEIVRHVQSNLYTASLQRNATHDLLAMVKRYNTTIQSTLDAVMTKATLANRLADEIHRNISISAEDINAIYQCFQDKQIRSNSTRTTAYGARAQAQDAARIHVENNNNMEDVSRNTEALDGKYTSFLQGTKEVKAEVEALMGDLGIVSGTNDVELLFERFSAQKTELEKLRKEVQDIDVDADLAESNLARLDPETASCSHT